jgi:hypothetical protein
MARFVLWLTVLILLTPYGVLPQKSERPASAHPDSDQVLQEILNEMRLLRAELGRTTVNIHRSQVLIERIRAQQDQVVRLRRDVSETHDKLDELKAQAYAKKRALDKVKFFKDLDPEFESEDMKTLTHEVEELDNRQQNLVQRESQLAKDLASAEGELAELNRRLDQIEWEMSRPAEGSDAQPAKRPQ